MDDVRQGQEPRRFQRRVDLMPHDLDCRGEQTHDLLPIRRELVQLGLK
jgi:hypothetical protein